MPSSKPRGWVWYGHVCTTFTFFLGIIAWTSFEPQARLILAILAGLCQLASITFYKLNTRQRMAQLEPQQS